MTKKTRRIIAGSLIVLGGIFLFLAPETMGGIALIAIGIVIEGIGIYLERQR